MSNDWEALPQRTRKRRSPAAAATAPAAAARHSCSQKMPPSSAEKTPQDSSVAEGRKSIPAIFDSISVDDERNPPLQEQEEEHPGDDTDGRERQAMQTVSVGSLDTGGWHGQVIPTNAVDSIYTDGRQKKTMPTNAVGSLDTDGRQRQAMPEIVVGSLGGAKKDRTGGEDPSGGIRDNDGFPMEVDGGGGKGEGEVCGRQGGEFVGGGVDNSGDGDGSPMEVDGERGKDDDGVYGRPGGDFIGGVVDDIGDGDGSPTGGGGGRGGGGRGVEAEERHAAVALAVEARASMSRCSGALEGGAGANGDNFEYLDHTADVQIHSWGDTIELAMDGAVVAMFNIITDIRTVKVDPSLTREVEVTGHDAISLLYSLLDEFLFMFHSEGLAVMKATVAGKIDRETWTLRATAEGEEFDLTKHPQGTEVKAITYSNMQINESPTGRTDIYVIVDI